jgi:hypothetical protein
VLVRVRLIVGKLGLDDRIDQVAKLIAVVLNQISAGFAEDQAKPAAVLPLVHVHLHHLDIPHVFEDAVAVDGAAKLAFVVAEVAGDGVGTGYSASAMPGFRPI